MRKRGWEPWPQVQQERRRGLRELQGLPVQREQREQRAWERREQSGGSAPAAAWSESCAERWEPQDEPEPQELRVQRVRPVQRELRVPAARWKRNGALWAAQERRELRDAERWVQSELRDAEEREPWEQPGAEESEEEEEYS